MTFTLKEYILDIDLFINNSTNRTLSMIGIIKKQLFITSLIILLSLFFTTNVDAASLTSISDIISTSRPSASAPLAVNQAAADTFAKVFDNGSTYLASDSAVIYPSVGETINAGLNVASMSAQISGNRFVYITNSGGITNAHHQGDAFIVNVTATHTVKFTTITAIPASGHIIIGFPGTGSNIASPSATTFAFNDISSSQITTDGVICTSWSITAPTLDCLVNASGVAASTTVTIILGCTTGTTSCTAFSPRLINPTKTAANICNNGETTCTSDPWKVTVSTTDTAGNGGTVFDTGSTKIATIEAVQVQATVEPTLTFTITGLVDTTNTNTVGACAASIVSNTGIDPTATFVNLGVLANGTLNKSIQRLRVSTNGSTGYSITATSSGRFINPASGVWIPDANGGNGLTANDTPVPAIIDITTPAASFGIHPCGARSSVNSDQWVNAGTAPSSGSNGTAKFSNPWNTGTSGFYNTIASYTAGPVTNDDTAIVYGATITGITPAGVYSNYYTYVATATF